MPRNADPTAGRRECPVCQQAMMPVAWPCCRRCAQDGHQPPAAPTPTPTPAPSARVAPRPATAAALADYAAAKAADVNDRVSSLDDLAEDAAQTAFEEDLQTWGYWPRTKERIRQGPPPMGWYYHHHDPRANGLLLDIVVLANEGLHTEIEIKGPRTKIEAHQQQLVDQAPHMRTLIRVSADTGGMDGARGRLRDWMLRFESAVRLWNDVTTLRRVALVGDARTPSEGE